MSMHGTSPLPAKYRKIQIRAGCAKARANPAISTDDLSKASSFATGTYLISQI
jgi:hypothetical protein